MHDEGVIKFSLRHRPAELSPRRYGEVVCRLVAWREILALTGLVGQQGDRYGGFAYGNVSARVGPPSAPRGRRSFLVTGTQTSGRKQVGLSDFSVVERYDCAAHRAESHGATAPSSESTTHAALYDLGSHVRFVFHAHSPVIWRRAAALAIPVSDPRADYGSAAMATEVQRLYRETALAETRLLAMGGHEDGVIAFGRSAEETGLTLLAYLARAYETQCLR